MFVWSFWALPFGLPSPGLAAEGGQLFRQPISRGRDRGSGPCRTQNPISSSRKHHRPWISQTDHVEPAGCVVVSCYRPRHGPHIPKNGCRGAPSTRRSSCSLCFPSLHYDLTQHFEAVAKDQTCCIQPAALLVQGWSQRQTKHQNPLRSPGLHAKICDHRP